MLQIPILKHLFKESAPPPPAPNPLKKHTHTQKKTRARERKSAASLFCHVSLSLFLPLFFCVFCCIADVVKGLHLKVMHTHRHTHI